MSFNGNLRKLLTKIKFITLIFKILKKNQIKILKKNNYKD